MRSHPILFLLLSMVFFSASVAAQQAPTTSADANKERATVAGNVLRLDTGEPLKKARVSLETHGREAFRDFVLTDEQGRFEFENVPAGAYDLEVSRNGYVDGEYGQKKPGAPGAILTLTPGQKMTDLVFKLARAASISGHVFDEDGEPIAKAEVIVYRASRHAGNEGREEDRPSSTNDLGEFRIFGLAPGRYYVAVNYRIQDYRGLISKEEKQRFNPGYLPTYYPDTTDPAKAQTIQVGAGDEIRSVDFMLRPGHLVTVSGRVINTIAGPTGGAVGSVVYLEPRGSGLVDAGPQLNTFPGEDGSFVIHNVPPGTYELMAYWGTSQRVGRPLDVGSTDIENLTLTITRGVDIPAHVTWEGTPVKDGAGVLLQLQPVEGQNLVVAAQRTKVEGTFQFKGVPEGTYRVVLVRLDMEGNYYLKNARYGSGVVSDGGFVVQAGSDASLDITISSRAARLGGLVVNGDGLAAVGATVVIIPDAPLRNVEDLYLSATTDQDGRFSIVGITPGDYKVFSWDSVDGADRRYGEDWFDAEWLKPYETKGEAVHLEEGDHKTVNVTVIEMSDVGM